MQAVGSPRHNGNYPFNNRAQGNMYSQQAHFGPYPQTPTGAQQNAAFTNPNALHQALSGLSVHGGGPMPGPGMSTPMSAGPLGHQAGNVGPYQYMQQGPYFVPYQGFPGYATMPRQGTFDPHCGPGAMPYPPHMHPLAPPGFHPGYQVVPLTPQPSLAELPTLETRRTSSGSKETSGHSASPDTPYLGATNQAAFHEAMAKGTVSPRINYGYETPSPPQYMSALKGRAFTDPILEWGSTAASKAIPPPVMAGVFPPGSRKPLNLCLTNQNRTRNVYIRGLHPATSDELLLAYGALFGPVESAKAIVDIQSGECKGFGFLLYRDMEQAEHCVRSFYAIGYEASFARESFNHTLKSLQDPQSSNLYFSNLPKSMNETELDAILVNYEIESTRILRDAFGNSRGVGFARLKNRTQCDEVIKNFNGRPVGEEELLLQVRYADTESQRHLKKETQHRRDFRSKEHNIAIYGSPAPRFQPNRHSRFATLPRAQGAQRAPFSSSLGGTAGEKLAKMMERSDCSDKAEAEASESATRSSESAEVSPSKKQTSKTSTPTKGEASTVCSVSSEAKSRD
ncbi:MAG: hypothetical protein M4579_005665 [Chaenotheca gracillima]|nr:MAG: hypothetical protein M4579_005665 [Chaenotheca gracillima]